MEVKINREIRQYTESMFFGLSMRQFFFSLAAVTVAVILYFVLRSRFGMETVSWMCILGAAPFAALGFITYHGMTAEQFIWAWIRSELLEPKELHFESVNTYQLLVNTARTKRGHRKGWHKPPVNAASTISKRKEVMSDAEIDPDTVKEI